MHNRRVKRDYFRTNPNVLETMDLRYHANQNSGDRVVTSCPRRNEDNFEITIAGSAYPIEGCIYIVMLIERINAPFIS